MLALRPGLASAISLWFQACSHPVHDTPGQDTSSRSAVVRFYYRHRLFMGFCCVCCELLYLALFLLHWPQYHAWPLLPLRLPGLTEAHPDGRWFARVSVGVALG